MRKKILITGAAGFLGQLAIKYFGKSYDLILTDRKDLNQKNFYKLDITNFNQINDLILKEKPSIILHYATEIFDSYNKNEVIKNNVYGTLNLIRSANINKSEQFIFTSTFSIFEKDYNYKVFENEPISCKNYYGLSKAESERILLSSEDNLNIVIFRCPVIVEKTRVDRLGVLFEFLKDNNTLWILGNGDNKIQFLSAIDLFEATEKSFLLKGKHIFNIGADKILSLKETFEFLIKKTNSKSKVKHFNKSIGLFFLKILSNLRLINFIDYHHKLMVSSIVMNTEKIQKVLGFKANKSNADLLYEAYDYYINNKNDNATGSAKKPKLGFFRLIKFFSKI
jgi:nucleoside-diphosphate-sugar epimerase